MEGIILICLFFFQRKEKNIPSSRGPRSRGSRGIRIRRETVESLPQPCREISKKMPRRTPSPNDDHQWIPRRPGTVVRSVDPSSAERLSAQRSAALLPIDGCIFNIRKSLQRRDASGRILMRVILQDEQRLNRPQSSRRESTRVAEAAQTCIDDKKVELEITTVPTAQSFVENLKGAASDGEVNQRNDHLVRGSPNILHDSG